MKINSMMLVLSRRKRESERMSERMSEREIERERERVCVYCR